jgi:hypothetical protein
LLSIEGQNRLAEGVGVRGETYLGVHYAQNSSREQSCISRFFVRFAAPAGGNMRVEIWGVARAKRDIKCAINEPGKEIRMRCIQNAPFPHPSN